MTIERPMFPPAADSARAFSPQPATGQPESETLTRESANAFEGIDLAQLRFVRCLIQWGATLEEASVVIAAELDRARRGAARRRRTTLIGTRLVPVA